MGVEEPKPIEIAVESNDYRRCWHDEACEKQAEDQLLVAKIQFGKGEACERRCQHDKKCCATADNQAVDEVTLETTIEPNAFVG